MSENRKLSIQFRMVRYWLSRIDMKQFFKSSPEEILEKARRMNAKFPYRLPNDPNFSYKEEFVEGFRCLRVRAEEKSTKQAILYLHGGGMILTAMPVDGSMVKDLAKKTGKEVWQLYYPLGTDYSIDVSFKIVHACYAKMLEEYAPEDIQIIGFSAGASLGIGMGFYNNEQANPLPMPARIVACCPGTAPTDQEILQEMERINERDFLIDIAFIRNAKEVLGKGKELPSYMISGVGGDYSNFPEVNVYYGEDEILSAFAPVLEKDLTEKGVPYTMHIEPSMFHCYMMFPIIPEAKGTWEEILQRLQ